MKRKSISKIKRKISEEELERQIDLHQDVLDTMRNPLHISRFSVSHFINPELTQRELEERVCRLKHALTLRRLERN